MPPAPANDPPPRRKRPQRFMGGAMWWERQGKTEPSAFEGVLHSRRSRVSKSSAAAFLLGLIVLGECSFVAPCRLPPTSSSAVRFPSCVDHGQEANCIEQQLFPETVTEVKHARVVWARTNTWGQASS